MNLFTFQNYPEAYNLESKSEFTRKNLQMITQFNSPIETLKSVFNNNKFLDKTSEIVDDSNILKLCFQYKELVKYEIDLSREIAQKHVSSLTYNERLTTVALDQSITKGTIIVLFNIDGLYTINSVGKLLENIRKTLMAKDSKIIIYITCDSEKVEISRISQLVTILKEDCNVFGGYLPTKEIDEVSIVTDCFKQRNLMNQSHGKNLDVRESSEDLQKIDELCQKYRLDGAKINIKSIVSLIEKPIEIKIVNDLDCLILKPDMKYLTLLEDLKLMASKILKITTSLEIIDEHMNNPKWPQRGLEAILKEKMEANLMFLISLDLSKLLAVLWEFKKYCNIIESCVNLTGHLYDRLGRQILEEFKDRD